MSCIVHRGLGCACSPRPMPMWGNSDQGLVETPIAPKTNAPAQAAVSGAMTVSGADVPAGGASGGTSGGESVDGYDGHALEESHELGCGCKKKKRTQEEPGPLPIFSTPALQPTEESRLESVLPGAPYRGPQGMAQAKNGKPKPQIPVGPMLARGGLGTLPDLPPPPDIPGPLRWAPIPPPTFQSPAPGLRPVGPRYTATPDQAKRFLQLAEDSLTAIRAAIDQAVSPTAKGRDRYIASGVFSCMGQLASHFPAFAKGLAELRAASKEERGAHLTGPQARAIEEFAECAAIARERAQAQIKVEAAVGTGLSTLAMALLAI